MRILGSAIQNSHTQAPVVVVGVFDAVTKLPSFALIQENSTEVATLLINGTLVDTDGILDTVTFDSSRPQQGGGILRQTASISIQTKHAKGYPFYQTPLQRTFYQGGQSIDSFYFGIWVIDRRNTLSADVNQGTFIGYFKVDAGARWTEKNGVTTIPLLDMLLLDQTKIGATNEAIPEQLFLYNSWFDASIVPKVFGYVPRIKMLNLFPSISVRKLANSINGIVQSNYTNSSPTIILEKYADQSSVLRQIVAVGGNVRVKMADGEVILGTVAYDSITGNVTLTVTTRNTYYGKVKGYSYPGNGQTPQDWGTSGTARDQNKWPGQWVNSESVLIDGRNYVQDPNGYLKATINFFDNAAVSKEQTFTVSVKCSGWANDKDPIIRHDPWTNASPAFGALSTCGLSTEFNASIVADPLISYGWAPGAYVYFNNVPKDVELWFNNPATAVAGSGSIGAAWQLVSVEPGSVDYSCIIRNGFSHFDNDHVYCEGDGRLIKIPTANISSVSDSGTVLGLAGMAKITLTAAPIDMGIGATSNIVYTDAQYQSVGSGNRTEQVIKKILDESSFLTAFAGGTITNTSSYTTSTWMPFCGVLVDSVQTVSSIIDRLLFQVNATFSWQVNLFELRQTGYTADVLSINAISGHNYIYPNLQYTDATEMMEDEAEFSCGQVLTAVDGSGYEYIPLYYDVSYGGWQDPFYKPVKPSVNRAIKPNQRLFAYKFDYVNDANSAAYAIGASLCIGHPSGLSAIERTITTKMLLKGIRWEACDPIVFRDFPMISTSDETNALLDSNGHPQYLVAPDGKRFIMGAVCQVEKVSTEFNSDAVPTVTLSAKQSQTFSEASGTMVYSPPFPPNPPTMPPANSPDTPPTLGGGSQSSMSFGGYYSPMAPVFTQPADITIDSTADYTSPFTLTVNSTFIWNEGWSYTIDVLAQDGQPITVGAVTFSGTAAGTFPDKINDAYVPIVENITLHVNYALFTGYTASTTRQLILRFTRTIKNNANPGSGTYQDTFDIKVNVLILDPRAITAS